MALLGTLVMSLLVAGSRMQRQAYEARLRMEGCRIADSLLEQLWADRGHFPRSGGGPVPGRLGWAWRTRVVPNHEAWQVFGEVVVLEVYREEQERSHAAARVELLLPVPREPGQGNDNEGLGPDAR